jgi:hypothetical protein
MGVDVVDVVVVEVGKEAEFQLSLSYEADTGTS